MERTSSGSDLGSSSDDGGGREFDDGGVVSAAELAAFNTASDFGYESNDDAENHEY